MSSFFRALSKYFSGNDVSAPLKKLTPTPIYNRTLVCIHDIKFGSSYLIGENEVNTCREIGVAAAVIRRA